MERLPWSLKKTWLDTFSSNNWNETISSSINWHRPSLRLYGKKHLIPRLTTFIASEDISYSYSGIRHLGQGWPDWITPLRDLVNHECGESFNGCLINLYRDGTDCMGWHADDELEIDNTKPIASLSLGGQRDFLLKHKYKPQKECVSLGNGDLLIMFPECQREWLHCLPRRKNKISRINLTFRCFVGV